MKNIIDNCKLIFSKEQTIIAFDHLCIEWIINSPIHDIEEINKSLKISNPPFKLEGNNQKYFAVISSYSEFFEYFLNKLPQGKDQEVDELIQDIKQDEERINLSIMQFNKIINES